MTYRNRHNKSNSRLAVALRRRGKMTPQDAAYFRQRRILAIRTTQHTREMVNIFENPDPTQAACSLRYLAEEE